jgi:hypothetical protein
MTQGRKTEVQQLKDALAMFPYTRRECENNAGHLLSSRQDGPPLSGRTCLRCGVEVPGAATRIADNTTITDPLNRMAGRKA